MALAVNFLLMVGCYWAHWIAGLCIPDQSPFCYMLFPPGRHNRPTFELRVHAAAPSFSYPALHVSAPALSFRLQQRAFELWAEFSKTTKLKGYGQPQAEAEEL